MSALVSVCIPVYNGESFIRSTIEMVLQQDYDNLEILVSDNASTDNTVSEILKIKDERVHLFQNETNLGMGANWNVLKRKAKGEYVIIVCADDYLLPGAIREKARVLDENPDVCIAFSSSYVTNDKGKIFMKRRPFHGNKKFDKQKIQRELFMKYNFFAEPTNNMIRRTAMDATGDYDTSLWYTIDWDFYLRLLNHGNAYYLDKPYEGFRLSTSSATGSNLKKGEKILADEQVFLEKYKTGKLISIDDNMIEIRERNVRRRLMKKMIFMKISGILAFFLKREV